jgi:ferritin-like metal-binding protein YciE
MATTQKSLEDLFLDTLKDIYYAEKQILRALPKMAKAAEADELRQAFQTHFEQTQGHVERLDQVFDALGKPARGKTCEAIQGILDEGKEVMEEYKGSKALDAGMISAAQAVEHYEIARYGTLKRWADELGYEEAASLLGETLSEEKETDQLLSRIADEGSNRQGRVEGGQTVRARSGKASHSEETAKSAPAERSRSHNKASSDEAAMQK